MAKVTMEELARQVRTGHDATHILVREVDKKNEARTGRIISAARGEKSLALLFLSIAFAAALAVLAYWFVIESGQCHCTGLWQQVAARDANGNLIPDEYVWELVAGARPLWGAICAAFGAALAALIHAVVPWYRDA